eukprot:m.1058038 g.1058038  ORF g.1058038 m.1058038 type:complete len:285 (+) comp24205_c0_seq61:1697-2551(+)
MESSDVRQTEELQHRERQETRLSELSAMVGQYEAARVADSAIIADLREECADLRAQLDDMLQHHTRATEGNNTDAGGSGGYHDNAAGRIATLEESVGKLKSLLFLANQRLAESGPAGSNPSPGGAWESDGRTSAEAWDDDTAGDTVAPPTWQQRGGGPVGETGTGSEVPDVVRARAEGDALYAHVQRLEGVVRAMRTALQQARDAECDAVGKLEAVVADKVPQTFPVHNMRVCAGGAVWTSACVGTGEGTRHETSSMGRSCAPSFVSQCDMIFLDVVVLKCMSQ